MVQFTIDKAAILEPLQLISGAVDKKSALPVLSHVILKHDGQQYLDIIASDTQIEYKSKTPLFDAKQLFTIAAPAKKLLDILKTIDDGVHVHFQFKEPFLHIKAADSSFKLTTLSPDNFPYARTEANDFELSINRLKFLELLQSTSFAMAQQDVRIYLNALLFDLQRDKLTVVATDGHRMALNKFNLPESDRSARLLLPRKSILELIRLCQSIDDEDILCSVSPVHFTVNTRHYQMMTGFVDARFPAYERVIPRNLDKQIMVQSSFLKKALSRIIIMVQEKSQGITLHMHQDHIILEGHNLQHDEAVDNVPARISGDGISISLNASYLMDILNYSDDTEIVISLSTSDSSILIERQDLPDYHYILMPLKI